MTHTLSGPPPAAGAWLGEGACVWVDGGWVDAEDPGAGVAAAPPAAEPLDAPALPDVLAPADGLEALEAPVELPFAAAVAALSIPPCPLQAPRPP